MAKKGNKNQEFSVLGLDVNGISKDSFYKSLLVLTCFAILTKLAVLFATTNIFGSFVDLFDISYYLQWAANTLSGQLPYIDFHVDYPILVLIPVLFPLPFAILTHDAMMYVYVYQIIMSVIDLFTLYCVYLIGLRLYGNKKAFLAGILYSTAFAASYFVLTKYDAFPTFWMMLAIMLMVYNKKLSGYIGLVLGFFTKIFPMIALPFMMIQNSNQTSIKTEIIDFFKCAIPIGIILFIPLFILAPQTINAYLFAIGTQTGVYVNTATYTIHSLLEFCTINVPLDILALLMQIIMIITVLIIIATAFVSKIGSDRRMIMYTLFTIAVIILCTKFHSPQYIVWMTPLFAILLADLMYGSVFFYLIQIFAYIEFPLLFNQYYVNLEYLHPFGTSGWGTIVIFFAMEYIIWIGTIIYLLYDDKVMYEQIKTLPSKLLSLCHSKSN